MVSDEFGAVSLDKTRTMSFVKTTDDFDQKGKSRTMTFVKTTDDCDKKAQTQPLSEMKVDDLIQLIKKVTNVEPEGNSYKSQYMMVKENQFLQ